jgi:hypothetical protein
MLSKFFFKTSQERTKTIYGKLLIGGFRSKSTCVFGKLPNLAELQGFRKIYGE